jgi:predicted nucleic acid-binding protein
VIYLDTSVLGALFFREPTAPAILARLETVGNLKSSGFNN